MAKKSRAKTNEKDGLVKIDIYYLPREQAEMYQVLREVVKEETIEWMKERTVKVVIEHHPEFGEGIMGYDALDQKQFEYFLMPQNISDAQKARDKDQLATYLEQYFSLK